jgi:myo-inositol-1(or 4)-monophosphatase
VEFWAEQQFLECLLKRVGQAGDILLAYFGEELDRYDKPGAGFSTQADLASERYLLEHLNYLFPEACFNAEESGMHGSHEYCWVIDPLDGTTNFAHGIPYFAISVALTYQGKPVIAVVYDPCCQLFFYASKNQGAFQRSRVSVQTKKIQVSEISSLGRAMISIGLPHGAQDQERDFWVKIQKIALDVGHIRYFGAAVLDQVMVACGVMEAVIFARLEWWDIAAGLLLIQEAGGQAVQYQGAYLGSNSSLFALLEAQCFSDSRV